MATPSLTLIRQSTNLTRPKGPEWTQAMSTLHQQTIFRIGRARLSGAGEARNQVVGRNGPGTNANHWHARHFSHE